MKIAETNIHADRFVKRASTVLISHYHRDHLGGINLGRKHALVVCSPLTAKLERIDPARVRAVAPGERCILQDGEREVAVTALEANHCPGSVMFFLEWHGTRVLYTGDFRLNDTVREQVSALPELNLLYLDGTYDDPRYDFPPQEEAIAQILALLRKREGRKAFVAIYSVGKNRVLEAAVRDFLLPFYTTKDKRQIYEIIGMSHLVTADRGATPFRAYTRGYLEHYFQMTKEFNSGDCLIIIPTGWTIGKQTSEQYHYVPYSEHCDYRELQEFRKLIHAKQTIKHHG